MSHCPHCGTVVGEGTVCPACGMALPGAPPARAPGGARTMVGVSAQDLGIAPAAAKMPVTSRTIVGMPAAFDPNAANAPSAANAAAPEAAPQAPAAGAAAKSRTIVGMPVPVGLGAQPAGAPRASTSRTIVGGVGAIEAPPMPGAPVPLDVPAAPPAGVSATSRTMIGVAMPGIAPTHEPAPAQPPPAQPAPAHGLEARVVPPAGELGATIGSAVPPVGPVARRPAHVEVGAPPRVRPKQPSRPPETSRRATLVIAAACVLAIIALLFGLFWHGAAPLSARAKVDAEGREVLEIRCPGCADGTIVKVAGGSGTIASHVADVPLASPLRVGKNRLSVAVDRPAKGRDETADVEVDVAYRIRPDLGTLQGDKPTIQIAIEAVDGTTITLDGKPVALANGRATQTLDVLDACTGLADEPTTLARHVPYTVTTRDGAAEKGTIDVSVGVLPLHIDAPGPHAVTEGKSFVLAGRTMKGAEVLAAGRPIPVRADGSFAQVMNVSSIGSTQIEVRAKMAGMAPRLTQIAVRRVDSLETAAADFVKQPLTTWAAVSSGIDAQAGKPVVLAGEVVEARTLNHQTIVLLDVGKKSGCTASGASPDACRARLVEGADAAWKSGDLVTAYGTVARAFTAPGHAAIPEIQVDFVLKGLR